MDFSIIFKIVAVGIGVTIVNQLLQKAGRDEYTLLVTIAGLIIALMVFIPELSNLKETFGSFLEF